MAERIIGNKVHLGWLRSKNGLTPVEIVESASGCDNTIVEREGVIEARLGPLEDSAIVFVDPARDKILNVFPCNGDGCQKVTVEFQGKGIKMDVFIPTA